MLDTGWLFVVDVTVDSAVEDAWNDWYDGTHLPEITDCPGFMGGSRYVSGDGDQRRYITIYEIEGPEVLETAEFLTRRGWGEFATHVQARTGLYHRRITAPHRTG